MTQDVLRKTQILVDLLDLVSVNGNVGQNVGSETDAVDWVRQLDFSQVARLFYLCTCCGEHGFNLCNNTVNLGIREFGRDNGHDLVDHRVYLALRLLERQPHERLWTRISGESVGEKWLYVKVKLC